MAHMHTYRRLIFVASIGLLLSLGIACTSRYRVDLYMTTVEVRKKVKLEGTEFVQGAVIHDATADEKLRTGSGNVVILNIGTRGDAIPSDQTHLLKFDEYFRCLIYVQMPLEVKRDTLNLQDVSFVQVQGRYDLSPEYKLFHGHSGTMIVDSIPKKDMYATLDGVFVTTTNDTLLFDGRFKVKVSR
jgi:hypothetical protein